jgi:hypothetical protein
VGEAAHSGLTRSRIRASDLDRRVWGIRRSGRATTLRERAELFAERLPAGTAFSHTTAAQLLGIPIPLSWELDERLHVTVEPPARAPHAAGLIGHRIAAVSGDFARVAGLRVTSAVRTWIDLGSMVSLAELVAAGDFVIHHRLPLATANDLSRRLGLKGQTRGTRMPRRALPYLDGRAESPPESELRLIITLGRLPVPDINHTLVDTETGKHLRPDFTFRKEKVILEYQGDYHRTKQQWRKDMTRRSRLETKGWYVMELNADDLKDPDELVARIRIALAGRG